MTGEDELVQHCTVDEPVDLRTALAAAAIEYLDVYAQRTIVIYQHAILMVIVTAGQATAARAFDVEFWKEPPNVPSPNPDNFLTTFIEELVAATGATRAES